MPPAAHPRRNARLVASALFALTAWPATAHAAGYRPIAPAEAERLIAAGRPLDGMQVTGDLTLPAEVRATLVLTNSKIAGDLLARSTEFHGVVDLTNTIVDGRTDLVFAIFDRLAVFESTSFESASFAAADFRGAASFRSATFAADCSFAHASFDRAADFAFATFEGPISFAGTDFRSVVDLAATKWLGDKATFDDARFGSEGRFNGAEFQTNEPASFLGTRFDGGGDLSGVFFAKGANFDLVDARGDLDFSQATFEGMASFSTVHLVGKADFSGATLHGLVNFDQANIGSLDLGDTSLGRASIIFPRLGRTRENVETGFVARGGRIGSLRLDPETVGRIRVGDVGASRETRKRALGLLETEARRADDLPAANQARVLRLGLARAGRPPVLKQLDWAFLWGIGGYLVRPLHPLVAIVSLFAIGVAARALAHRRRLTSPRRVAAGLRAYVRRAFAAVRQVKVKRKRPLVKAETLAHKALLLIFVTSLGNVSPPIRNLVEGLLP